MSASAWVSKPGYLAQLPIATLVDQDFLSVSAQLPIACLQDCFPSPCNCKIGALLQRWCCKQMVLLLQSTASYL